MYNMYANIDYWIKKKNMVIPYVCILYNVYMISRIIVSI